MLITEQLLGALSQLEKNLPEEVGKSAHFLSLLYARVTYLNNTLASALDNYNDIDLANRNKRGFIDGTEQHSRVIWNCYERGCRGT